VVLDDRGVTDFDRLRAALAESGDSRAVFLYAFDLIELNGTDLRPQPWIGRREALASLLIKAGKGITLSEHYRDWIKIKNPDAMVEEKPIGWLIEVKGGGHGVRRGRFAVLTNTLQRAKRLVADHVALTTQRIEFDRTLTSEEVGKLGLKPEKITEYVLKPVNEQDG